MDFCEKLVESIDYTGYVSDVIHKLQSTNNKIYIFGAGDRAQWLGKFLTAQGIEFEGYLVNEKYYNVSYKANMYGGNKSIFIFENTNLKGCNLLLGIPQSKLHIEMFNDRGIAEVITINIGNRNDYIFKKETLIEHAEDINYLYNNLADELSKDCLNYCLRGRLTGEDYEFKPSNWTDPEYFFDEFIEWENCKCIVDCGAYIGDSVQEFKRKKPQNISDEYKIYAFEPDKDNYLELKKAYIDDERIIPVNAAVYSYNGKIGFSNDSGEMSAIDISGEGAIECRSIDSVLGNQRVDFIKMDVEGSELAALKGASNHIKNDVPILAICIYHKQEDFWTIPQFIKSLNNKYKLFIRPHSSMPTELVLFAVQ